MVKNPAANAEDEGDTDSLPGSGRFSDVGNGKRKAWQASPWGHIVGHDLAAVCLLKF